MSASFLFWKSCLPSCHVSTAGLNPLPPRRMQRSSSKLSQLRHSASLGSLQRRTVNNPSFSSPRSHDARVDRSNPFREALRGFLEETARGHTKDKRAVVERRGLSVVDRAANWAHVKHIKNRRVPPQGIPQQSVEKILSSPLDILDGDEVFNTDIGDQTLPKGSFLEVRRSVSVELFFFVRSQPHQEQRGTSRSRHGPILLWSYSTNTHSHDHGRGYPVQLR